MVPSIYVSDVKLNFPEKKYKIGSKVKARVLSVDTERNRIKLTFKRHTWTILQITRISLRLMKERRSELKPSLPSPLSNQVVSSLNF